MAAGGRAAAPAAGAGELRAGAARARRAAAPFAQAMWTESYEAEQHLLHLGLSTEPVCWTLCGFASGYLSYCHGRSIYCLEERCRGKGDAVCRMVGPAERGVGRRACSRASPYYEPDAVNEALGELAQELKRAERRLASRARALERATVHEAETGLVARERGDAARRSTSRGAWRRWTRRVLLTRRERRRQGALARLVHDALGARAAGPFVARQLRGGARGAARERAVRPRPRRVHRRDAGPAGPVRGGQRRHAAARRDRRAAAGHAGEAAARAAGARGAARRREPTRGPSTCA